MKKIKALSLIILCASAQIDSVASSNAELSLVLTYQALDNFARAVASDRDDIGALNFLDIMQKSITFDAQQKQQIAATQDGYLSKGVALDPKKVVAQNQELQARIDTLNKNIKAFEKGGVTAVEKKKVDARRAERKSDMATIAQSQAALAQQISAENQIKIAQGLLVQNQLAFEQALESYINAFGQVYQNNGSLVISSKYSQNMPITPKEYAQLIATLKNASNQFGSSVLITLNFAHAAPASIKDVTNYVSNMAPAGASWKSYAGYALAATAVTAAAIAAVAIASNVSQGKNWNDTSDAQALANTGYAQAQSGATYLQNSAASAATVAQASLSDVYNYLQQNNPWANNAVVAPSSNADASAQAQQAVQQAVQAAPETVAQLATQLAAQSGSADDAAMAKQIEGAIDGAEQSGQEVQLDAQESNWLMKGLAVAGVAGAGAAAYKAGVRPSTVMSKFRRTKSPSATDLQIAGNNAKDRKFHNPNTATQDAATIKKIEDARATDAASIENRKANQLAAMSPRKYAQENALAQTEGFSTQSATGYKANSTTAKRDIAQEAASQQAAQQAAAQQAAAQKAAMQQAAMQQAGLYGAGLGATGAIAAGANALNS